VVEDQDPVEAHDDPRRPEEYIEQRLDSAANGLRFACFVVPIAGADSLFDMLTRLPMKSNCSSVGNFFECATTMAIEA
jgi:hypothetical protein